MFPYMIELTHQAQACAVATDQWNQLATRGNNTGSSGPSVAEWFAVAQSLLAAAAMFSKVLWPNPSPELDESQREWMRRRGKSLRRTLGISSIPALESRAVRNSFEHFDDRLDSFVRDPDRDALVDLIIGSTDDFHMGGVPEEQFMRRIDPLKGEVAVLGSTVLLGDLISAMLEIGESADAWMRESFVRRREAHRREDEEREEQREFEGPEV